MWQTTFDKVLVGQIFYSHVTTGYMHKCEKIKDYQCAYPTGVHNSLLCGTGTLCFVRANCVVYVKKIKRPKKEKYWDDCSGVV